MRSSSSKKASESLGVDGSEFRKILTDCLLRHRHRHRHRHIRIKDKNCNIIWQDIDLFNLETKDKRDSKKITISSEKFVSSIKEAGSRAKELRLLAISEHIINENANSVRGSDKYLMAQIIKHNGYENYINNGIIQKAANSPNTKMSPQLKQKLLNIASKIQLVGTIYTVVKACKKDLDVECLHSAGLFGYSNAIKPAYSTLLKKLPQFIDNLAIISGKVLPEFFGHSTQFAVSLARIKYGPKVLTALGPGFDAMGMAIAAYNLFQCNNRQETSNPCSDKEIRDSIVSMSISSVSFVAGSILVAKGVIMGPYGIVLGITVVAVTGIYDGISNIIEYEEKYDTTHGENWSIFWRSLSLQKMPLDVQFLRKKTNDVNEIATYTVELLKNSSSNIVAYGAGLGKVVQECHIVSNINLKARTKLLRLGIVPTEPIESCQEVADTTLHSGHSDIDLSASVEKYANKLSRVLPKHIEGMSFICLPALTDSIYEKEDTSKSLSSYPDVKHYCNNSVVIEHNARMQNSSITEKSVLFDLRYVNFGEITGSDTLNNIFLINNVKEEGNEKQNVTVVSGTSVKNDFEFIGSSYQAKLLFSNNSVNIIHMESSKAYPHASELICTNGTIIINQQVYGKSIDTIRTDNQAVDSKDKFSIQYKGIYKERDDIHCKYEAHNAKDNSDKCEGIDTGGGTMDGVDSITNCKNVTIWHC